MRAAAFVVPALGRRLRLLVTFVTVGWLLVALLAPGRPAAAVGPAPGEDASYWIGRMEAALLPQSSLRAEARIETSSAAGLVEEASLHIARVQGPRRLRTLLTIREQGAPVRIERVEFDGEKLERTVFQPGSRDPEPRPVSRSDPVGRSEFTYEDLAFADFQPRAHGSVERRPARAHETIEVTADGYGPYGKVVTLLRADTALPTEVLYFDEAGRQFRTSSFSGFETKGPYTFPTRWVVENQDTGRKSVLTFSETLIGPEIYEDEFSSVQIEERLETLQNETTEPEALF